MSPGSEEAKISFFANFFLSGAAAGICKTIAAPIDRVKLLMQNQGEMLKQGRLDRGYSGLQDCIVRTYNEGITSFWRGNFANLLRYFTQQAFNFTLKDEIQKILKVSKQSSPTERFAKNIASGACAGSMALVFVQSFDYTRTRLGAEARVPAGQRQFKGIADVYIKTIKADGLRGLYRGFGISCVGVAIYRGLYFGLYDSLVPLLGPEDADTNTSLNKWLLGYGVTVVSSLAGYPLDTLKRRMMLTAGQKVKYASSLACLKEIVAREGARVLYKGFGVNLVRSCAGATLLPLQGKFKRLYLNHRYRDSLCG